ncbi:unnamed protein product [Ceutorhynchus assimilis]|uniref:TRAF3-interacting protein 1 n=1 Tax=Ceutorhynchus assimilis TaxID=467358 RepID=A0A9N9MBJ4_9CUCU|nr:unnamed protein product [Ceutorhynchus assimilis]
METELNSDNVKEKEAKLAFLTKLIEAIKVLSKTDLKVRPSKIVAGLEPTETNILLQTIAKCIDKKISSNEYVAKINSAEPTGKTEKKSSTKKRETIKKGRSIETPKTTDRAKESSRSKETNKKDKKVSNKPEEKSQKKTKAEGETLETKIRENHKNEVPDPSTEDEPELIIKETINEAAEPLVQSPKSTEPILNQDITSSNAIQPLPNTFSNARQSSANLIRPKSARPKSGDRVLSSRGPKVDEIRPQSSLRPPSVRPSSARPGAPKLRPESALVGTNIKVIVESFDSMLYEDGTVVIENAPEETTNEELVISTSENQGQLVEQILEQIQEKENIVRRVDINWEQDGLRGKDATTKEVTQLRSLIQSLTKTANPLGKLMNYLHEDLDVMHNELKMWTNMKKQLYMEIEKQKKLTVDSSKPLLEQLDQFKQEVKKLEQEIFTVRSNVLRNEQRISEFLDKN